MSNTSSIGGFIAALRKANGLAQKQLAEKLNVSDKSVFAILYPAEIAVTILIYRKKSKVTKK